MGYLTIDNVVNIEYCFSEDFKDALYEIASLFRWYGAKLNHITYDYFKAYINPKMINISEIVKDENDF